MCGIAGVLGRQGSSSQMSRVLPRLAQRGPDDSGVATIDSLAILGHTRLAVIDLSHAGHQPMADPSGRYTITFNGEIYNHRELRNRAETRGWKFRGSSDTEVLLACWVLFGDGVLHDLNGMFAFCIVDRDSRTAWLVRDRFGVKPLFVRNAGGRVEFASTPDVLATEAGPLGFDKRYLSRGLATWGHDSDEADSAFTGIEALPGGTMMRVGLDPEGPATVRTTRWYDLDSRVPDSGPETPVRLATAEVRALVEDSVALRMRADVPVGLSLSGGLDSSIIAALASENASQPVQAFFFSLGPRDKEALAVAELARTLGPARLNVEEVGPPRRDEMREVIEDALLCQGAPVVGLSSLAQYQVFRAAHQRGITVMLGGQGADEAFMGYRKYQAVALRQLLHQRHFGAASRASAALVRALASEGRDVRNYILAARRYRQRAPARGLAAFLPHTDPIKIPASPRELQLNDVAKVGLPTLLRLEDRNSMAHSTESRHPFMDYRVMECGVRLGVGLNVRNGYGKWILRTAFSSDIPRSIAWARFKRGFDPGDRLWLDAGAGAHLRDIISRHRGAIAEALEVPKSAVDPGAYTDGALEASALLMSDALTLAWIGLTLKRESTYART